MVVVIEVEMGRDAGAPPEIPQKLKATVQSSGIPPSTPPWTSWTTELADRVARDLLGPTALVKAEGQVRLYQRAAALEWQPLPVSPQTPR